MKKGIIAGGLTQEEIDELKKEHGELLMVGVGGKEKEYFWFKKPNASTMSNYLRLQNNDPYRAGQVVFNDCLVKGRPEASEDVTVFMNVLPQLSDIIEQLEVEVKKF